MRSEDEDEDEDEGEDGCKLAMQTMQYNASNAMQAMYVKVKPVRIAGFDKSNISSPFLNALRYCPI
jgi:hypothetical protein